MTEKIFGYGWADIQAAQHGHSLQKPIPHRDQSLIACDIQRDIDRFHIPIDKSVKDTYGLVLPNGYILQGETWIFTKAT